MAVLLIIASCLAVAFYLHCRDVKSLERMRTMDLNWYKATYPNCIDGKLVVCNKCGSTQAEVREVSGVKNAFICSKCHTGLFFDPDPSEDRALH